MKNTAFLFILMSFLCSCEFLGWDSSGGNNCDLTDCERSDINKGVAGFLIDAPSGYPLSGTSEITATPDGDVIDIPGIALDSASDLNQIDLDEALFIVLAACDSTATSVDSVAVATDATITWTNSNADNPSLTISDATVGATGLRLISCLAL